MIEVVLIGYDDGLDLGENEEIGVKNYFCFFDIVISWLMINSVI